MEVELDLSGEFSRENTSRPSLGNTKEAHLSDWCNFEQQEDVKLYGQLPDYDDSQCYDLGKEDLLLQVVRRIYANSHKPSWGTLKRHLFSAGIPKKLLREIKSISRNGKKGDSNRKECLGEWLKSQYHILPTS